MRWRRRRPRADPRKIAELEQWHANWESAGERGPKQELKSSCAGPLKAHDPTGYARYDPYQGDPDHPANCICKVRL